MSQYAIEWSTSDNIFLIGRNVITFRGPSDIIFELHVGTLLSTVPKLYQKSYYIKEVFFKRFLIAWVIQVYKIQLDECRKLQRP